MTYPINVETTRIIITLREPYNKTYYLLSDRDKYDHLTDITDYFIVRFDPGVWTDYEQTEQGLTIYHETGVSFYPWTAIQEIDFFEKDKVNG